MTTTKRTFDMKKEITAWGAAFGAILILNELIDAGPVAHLAVIIFAVVGFAITAAIILLDQNGADDE